MRARLILENVIEPTDFTPVMNKLKEQHKEIRNLKQLNDLFRRYGVMFCEFEEFYDSLANEKEREAAPEEESIQPQRMIHFALYNEHLGKVMVVISAFEFFRFLNGNPPAGFYNHIEQIIEHESVHREQLNRGGRYTLENSPNDMKKYLSDKTEIMAFAQSLVHDLIQHYSKDEIKNLLRKGDWREMRSWIWDNYKKSVSQKDFNRFKTYCFLYLEKS